MVKRRYDKRKVAQNRMKLVTGGEGKNSAKLGSTIEDVHRRSRGAEEKQRSTKSSALHQQVGFVRRNKGTKMC